MFGGAGARGRTVKFRGEDYNAEFRNIWPDGTTQELTGLESGRTHAIAQP